MPVGFHPTGQASLRDDIARRYLDHPNGRVIGVAGRNPMELMLAFASFAAGGVLERHPGLRCAFLEGTCGWLPWWLWRLDEAWEKFGPGSEVQISQLPSQYFFRQCYVATDADEKVLRQVVEAVGDDNIVVSTDYPHSDGLFPSAIEEFTALEGVSDKTKSQDPLGQLRAALQDQRRPLNLGLGQGHDRERGEPELLVDVRPRPAVGASPLGGDVSGLPPPLAEAPVDDDLNGGTAAEVLLQLAGELRVAPRDDEQEATRRSRHGQRRTLTGLARIGEQYRTRPGRTRTYSKIALA